MPQKFYTKDGKARPITKRKVSVGSFQSKNVHLNPPSFIGKFGVRRNIDGHEIIIISNRKLDAIYSNEKLIGTVRELNKNNFLAQPSYHSNSKDYALKNNLRDAIKHLIKANGID